MKKKETAQFPRIVTNGWNYRIEISEGEYYSEIPLYLPFSCIIEFATFRAARKQLIKLIKEEAIRNSPWRPVYTAKP
jgi:hypothetical protein